MPTRDPAKAVKDALAADWATAHPTWQPTLHVDDDWTPGLVEAMLLVADDGGPAVNTGAQPWQKLPAGYSAPFRKRAPRRPLIRMTAFAAGRSTAREVVDAAADWVIDNRPPDIARIEDVSSILTTRDPATGNYLASVTMPVLVRPMAV